MSIEHDRGNTGYFSERFNQIRSVIGLCNQPLLRFLRGLIISQSGEFGGVGSVQLLEPTGVEEIVIGADITEEDPIIEANQKLEEAWETLGLTRLEGFYDLRQRFQDGGTEFMDVIQKRVVSVLEAEQTKAVLENNLKKINQLEAIFKEQNKPRQTRESTLEFFRETQLMALDEYFKLREAKLDYPNQDRSHDNVNRAVGSLITIYFLTKP